MTDVMASPRTALTKRSRLPITVGFAGLFLAVIVVLVIAGPLIAPHDPGHQDLLHTVAKPSGTYWLGTDQLGRDVLSQVIAGARVAILGPLCVALGTVVIGATLGILAGYRGGLVDVIINRFADLMYALPGLLVIIVIIGIAGGGYWLAVAVLTLLSVPGEIRLSRSAARVQAGLPYVEAARTLGLPSGRILLRHILPNIMATVIATFLLDIVGALIGLSGLSYLGLGAPPGTPDWGTLLQQGQALLTDNPWISLAPAVMIALTATSVTLVGDWLYDRYSLVGER